MKAGIAGIIIAGVLSLSTHTASAAERYRLLTLTPDMPVPGAMNDNPQTQGMRLIGLGLSERSLPRRDNDYTEVTRQFTPGATRMVRYQGRMYRVVGDVYMTDTLSDPGKWDKGQSSVTGEYYEILDKQGQRSGKGLCYPADGC